MLFGLARAEVPVTVDNLRIGAELRLLMQIRCNS